MFFYFKLIFSSVQSLSYVQLFVTTWTTARQVSLSMTNSRSSLKLMSIQLVMPSSHLILCHSLLLLPTILPSIRVFSNESTLRMRWQSIRVSTSASVLPVNTKEDSTHGHHQSTPKSDRLYSLQPNMEKLYTVSKNKTGSWLWLRSWTPYCQIQT